jgi:adenylosuccinate synthase
MLDIDFGTYPFVTSSNTITSGVCNGLGIAPSAIGEVIGIVKAYCTRVGSGPFPSELDNEMGEKIRRLGSEFGATTGRPRRCGWLDIPQLLYTIMLNGVTQIVMTKLDILDEFETIDVATHYSVDGANATTELPYDLCDGHIEMVTQSYQGWNTSLDKCDNFNDLPIETKSYISAMSSLLRVPITMISSGPERRKLMGVPR